LPGDDTAGFLTRLRSELKSLESQGVFAGFDVRLIKETSPYETAADSPLIARLKSSVADLGVAPVACGVGWYSDAGPFSRVVKNVAVFGPGSIAQAHTADEFIELDSLEKGAAIIRRWLHRTAEGS
jgi:acetylornithine deacetylase